MKLLIFPRFIKLITAIRLSTLVFLTLFFASTGFASPVGQMELAGKQILLLMSNGSSHSSDHMAIHSIHEYFNDTGAIVRVEILDSNAIWDMDYQQSVIQLLERKLRVLPKPDVVIASDDDAVQLLIDKKIEGLVDIPTIFLHVSDQMRMTVALEELPATGLVEMLPFQDTVLLVKSLFPESNRLVVLHDQSSDSLNYLNDLRGLLDQDERLEGLQFYPVNIDSLLDQGAVELPQIHAQDVFLWLAQPSALGRSRITTKEIIEQLRAELSIPLFYVWQEDDIGALGGAVVDRRQEALLAASMAQSVLLGENVRDIEAVFKPTKKVVFDYNELQKFGLSADDIASNAQVLHKPQPQRFGGKYLDVILWAALLVILLGAVAIVVAWVRMLSTSLATRSEELRSSKKALVDSERKFRTIFEKSVNGIILSREDTGEILEYNQSTQDILGLGSILLNNKRLQDLLVDDEGQTEIEDIGSDRSVQRIWVRNLQNQLICLHRSSRKVSFSGEELLLTIISDVTREEEQKRFIATLLKTAPIGIGSLKQGRINMVNRRFCNELGRDEKAVIGLSLSDMFESNDSHLELDSELEAQLLTHDFFETERVIQRDDGKILYLLMRFSLANPAVPEEGIVFTLQDVSEYKHFNSQIRVYMDAFEQASDAILITDSEFNVQHSNRVAKMIFGYDDSELSGMAFSSLLAPNKVPSYWDKLHSSILGNNLKSVQLRLRDSKGYEFLCESKFSEIYDQTGKQEGYLIVSQDITVRNHAEQRLRASESRFRMLLEDNVTVAVQGVNRDGKVIYWNVAAEKLFGLTSSQVVGRSVSELSLSDPHYKDIFSGFVDYDESGENPDSHELVINIKGTKKTMYSQTVLLQAGQPEQELFRINVDLTPLKRVENELSVSDLRYRTLFEDLTQGVIVLNSSGDILDVNQAAKDIVGSDLDSWDFNFLDYDFSQISPEKSQDGTKMSKDFLRALLSHHLVVRNETVELRHLQTDEPVWVSVDVLFPKTDNQDLSDHAYVIFSDITDARILQDALVQTQRMEAVGQLTGGVAHDFNNILASLIGFAELAKLKFGTVDPKLERYLMQILSSGQRARDLVRQLLIFSRGSTTKGAEPMSLTKDLHELIAMLRPMLPASIEVTTNFSTPGPVAVVDPVHLQQIVMNLAINARDATGESGTIVISLNQRRFSNAYCQICNSDFSGDWVVVSVADNGPGIDPAVKKNLFQPFVSTKEVGKGTGMGLAVVSGLIKSYGGHIVIDSPAEGGTVFSVLFKPNRVMKARGSIPLLEVKDDEVDLGGLRVLIVDDEELIVQYLDELLSNNGLDVFTAHSGIAAQKLLFDDPKGFDLIITDQTMPGMSGIDLVHSVNESGLNIPAIICSGYHVGLTAKQRSVLNIHAVLTKPVALDKMLSTIYQAVGREEVSL